MKIHDYIVVGSGCAGSMAAQTLVEAGVNVTMIDVGFEPDAAPIPDKNFLDIRQTEPDQHQYLIGKKAEGVIWSDLGKGAQLTPARKYMVRDIDRYTPLLSETFSPLESLGYGGLGIGWGLQCWQFSDTEMVATGLNPERMTAAYETVSRRIGISATKDDAMPYTMNHLQHYQPSPKLDRNHQAMKQRYSATKAWFKKRAIYLGRTPLALITKDLNGRRGYQYRDMDFYSDNDRSAWRPWITIDALKKKPNFTYISGYLALEFKEKGDTVTLTCLNVKTHKKETFVCRKLVLAAGALGSARIVLRAFKQEGTRVPLLCNPYTYVPCLQPGMIGKGPEKGKLGFGQLSMFIDKGKTNFDISIATFYGYQSLMLFRIIRQVPLNLADARRLMQFLVSGIVIMGIQHTDHPSERKYLTLAKNPDTLTGDQLEAHYELTKDERAVQDAIERTYIKAARKLRIFPLKRLYPGHGSSVHYAGTLPFSSTEKPLHLSYEGRLHGTKHVYVADSSGFTFLPARGLTFSLLANAHIIAENVLQDD